MSVPCGKWQDEMLDGLSTPLPEERQAALDQHLAGCPSCREYLETLQSEDRALADFAGGFDAAVQQGKERVMAAVSASGSAGSEIPNRLPSLRGWGTRSLRYGSMAAAVAIVVFGAFSFLSNHSKPGEKLNPWWLGPSAVWAQEISTQLEKVKALVYQEQPILVTKDGATHVSGSWRRLYVAADRQRIDQYYTETLVSTGWEWPEDNDLLKTDVSFEYQCYTTQRLPGEARQHDPVEGLRQAVERLSSADRLLGMQMMEGRQCVGFDISASKYGDNPEKWVDRIWFDTATRLPVRIERHGLPVTGRPEESLTLVQDYFEYHAEVPANLFEPVVPAGYVNAHPDEVRKARAASEQVEK